MTTNPNQGPRPDPYGGYGGYQPSNSVDDPYGTSQPGGSQHSDPNYVYGQRSQGQQSSDSQAPQQQQQFNYEVPDSVLRRQGGKSSGSSAPFTSAASQGSTEKEDRKFACCSYLGLCFTGIVFFFLKKERPVVRFHAAQSVILFVPILALLAVLSFLAGLLGLIPLGIGWLLGGVIMLLVRVIAIPVFILWVALMVLAYQGVRVKLPIVGHYAEAIVERFSSEKRTA